MKTPVNFTPYFRGPIEGGGYLYSFGGSTVTVRTRMTKAQIRKMRLALRDGHDVMAAWSKALAVQTSNGGGE